MGHAEINDFARQVCGLPPSYRRAMEVVDSSRPRHRGDTTDIEFMGFDLVVETDYMGHVEGVMNAKDGRDCFCMFSQWALDEIKVLAHAEQLARSAPDADEPMLGETDGSGV